MMQIPYTRDRSEFTSHLLGWGIVLLAEGLVVVTLILVFTPTLWLKLMLLGAWVALTAWLVGWHLTSPLRTRHSLDGTTLRLQYGTTRIDIPRARIRRAEAIDGRTGPAFVPRPIDDEARDLLRITFSRQGQILLHLDPPLELTRKRGVFEAGKVLFNADNRDAVLEALSGDAAFDTPVAMPSIDPRPEAITVPAHDLVQRPIAIEAIELSRAFGARLAVDNLTFGVHAGEIYGFIGPNGAGKTTTISMLVGLLAPTSGIVRIAGHDIAASPIAAKQALGYVPDKPVLYDTLTGRENLEFIAQMRGMSQRDADVRIGALFDTLALRDRGDELVRSWSFGMRNKLSLAMALLHRPSVLILDEPFNGLDPQTSHNLRELVLAQALQETSVLLSTHDLSLVERMCHRIGVIEEGRLIAEGSPADIRHQAVDLESAFLAMTGHGTAP